MKNLLKTPSATLLIFIGLPLISASCTKSDIRPQIDTPTSFQSMVDQPAAQLSNMCPTPLDHKEKIATEIAQVIFDEFYEKRIYMPLLFGIYMSKHEYQSKGITDWGQIDAYYTIFSLTKPHIVGKDTRFWKKDALKGAIADYWQKFASLENSTIGQLEQIRNEVYKLSAKKR